MTKKLRFLITAGPTREYLDPVRYLSNRSSGKMGYALAAAAARFGRVTLVSGPVALAAPQSAKLIRVVTAGEMARAVLRESRNANVVIQCAAVADFKPARVPKHKIKKTGRALVLKLVPAFDILAALGRRKKRGQVLVGFAAETRGLRKSALAKLRRKNLDYIVANPVGRKGTGFDADTNEALVIGSSGFEIRFPGMTKARLARKLIPIFLGIPKSKIQNPK